MMTLRFSAGLFATAAAAFLLVSGAEAKEHKISFVLSAKQEVPAVTADGKGHGTVVYDDKTQNVKYHIEFSGLSGDATAAHFHGPAAVGEKGDVIVPIKSAPYASPLIGSFTLTPEQGKALLEGKVYFNLHTAANPGGELRGQVSNHGGKAMHEGMHHGDKMKHDKMEGEAKGEMKH